MKKVGSIDIWSHYYERKNLPTWPSETLVRSLKGSYIDGIDKKYKGKRVLDIGFGDGGNLFFLDTLLRPMPLIFCSEKSGFTP